MALSHEEILNDSAVFQDFKGSRHYAVWMKYLELMCADVEARLINGEDAPLERLRLYQGMLKGLKMASDVPTSVEKWAKQANEGSLGKLSLG